MKKESNNKLFVVRSYIMARNAAEALRKAKTAPIDEVWVDEEWKKGNTPQLANAIGFTVEDEHS